MDTCGAFKDKLSEGPLERAKVLEEARCSQRMPIRPSSNHESLKFLELWSVRLHEVADISVEFLKFVEVDNDDPTSVETSAEAINLDTSQLIAPFSSPRFHFL